MVCVSCTSRTIYKKPHNLISKEKMVDLWTDIYLANAAKNIKNIGSQRKINYLPLVYNKYKIDSTTFMESNVYYTSKIETYEKMFQEVEERILKLKAKYDPEYEEIDAGLPIHIKDSIRRSRNLERLE
tara:strand:- start:280169 stop:280552 length:384 start_codon:yes stop_codon:yes gene_type:complete